ncbi:hypothetical protein X975_01898, partial [Stegodyphus mimosarum]
MFEVTITFNCPLSRNVHSIGEKTISVLTIRYEKTSFTCILGCATNGTRLTTLIIFKRKTVLKETSLKVAPTKKDGCEKK